MNKLEYENISAFHPGYYIGELIKDMEMTQDEFAKRLNITSKNLSDLINGKAFISENIARNLSLMLGTSVAVWLDLQKKYEQKVLEIKTMQARRDEEKDLALVDYPYFVKLGVVPPTKDKADQISALFKYFSISSFSVFKKPDFLVQFRQSQSVDEKTMMNSNAWVQTVINMGRKIETQPYSEKKLKSFLPKFREMTLQDPAVFLPQLLHIFSECGVAFVLTPSLKNSGIYGAAKWAGKDKVILGMTDRGKTADIFWFSLFHELGHVLQKKVTKTIVDFDTGGLMEAYEEEADRFAKDMLIPPKDYEGFLAGSFFSEQTIGNFAEMVGIHPGIVVGRLQKEGLLPYTHLNQLKKRYVISG